MTRRKKRSEVDGGEIELLRHYHFVLGCAAEATGQFKSAFAHYRLEVRSTGYFKAYHNLGGLLLSRRRFGEAIAAFGAAAHAALRARRKEDAADSLTSLGAAYARHGEIAKAKSAWRRAAKLHSANARPLINLGLQQLFEGDIPGGASLLEQGFRRRPQDLGVRRWVGYALAKYDLDVPRALRFLQEAQLSTPRDASLLADLSMAYQKLGRRLEAVRNIRRAARIDPENYDVRAQLKRLQRGKRRRRQEKSAAR